MTGPRERFVWACLAFVGAIVAIVGVVTCGSAMHDLEVAAAQRTDEYRLKHPDAIACREMKGFPVWSNWTGQMVECRPLTGRAPQ